MPHNQIDVSVKWSYLICHNGEGNVLSEYDWGGGGKQGKKFSCINIYTMWKWFIIYKGYGLRIS